MRNPTLFYFECIPEIPKSWQRHWERLGERIRPQNFVKGKGKGKRLDKNSYSGNTPSECLPHYPHLHIVEQHGTT
jgi:hypothetical protein